MKLVKTYALIFGAASILAALLAADTALAADGAAQTETFIKNIVKILVGLAGIVAVIYMVFGGFLYITSSGNPEKLDQAKRTLFWAGIGLVIVIAAYAIVDIVAGAARSAFGG